MCKQHTGETDGNLPTKPDRCGDFIQEYRSMLSGGFYKRLALKNKPIKGETAEPHSADPPEMGWSPFFSTRTVPQDPI